jgi:hypothetical protein
MIIPASTLHLPRNHDTILIAQAGSHPGNFEKAFASRSSMTKKKHPPIRADVSERFFNI